MRQMIENFTHHKDDYECMWNGIEDMYMNITGEFLPNQFFFAMSGFCTFAYIKTNKADIKRMVSFNDGRTAKMFQLLSPIVGFDYRFIVSKTPQIALEKAKKEIDSGYPVVLGALDMYYLEYYSKLYHKDHIPFHYVLMVGYDDEQEVIYLYDCGKDERMELSYDNLFMSMNAEYAGLSKKNTICIIRMNTLKSKKHIIKTALEYKANLFTNPPTGFLGINGIKKLAKELPHWKDEIGQDQTTKILRNMVDFFGSVPKTPNQLLGINEKEEITYMCSRDKMGTLLKELGNEYKSDSLTKASDLFWESGVEFEKLCGVLIDYILENNSYECKAVSILSNIAQLEYNAFKFILDGIKVL